MGDLVNLRRARKAKRRADAEAQAQTARLQHGRSTLERTLIGTERRRSDRLLDGHRRDDPDRNGEP